MLYGIIDIGSNTVRLTVYEADPATGGFSTLFKLKTMAGLVSYIDKRSGRMEEAGVRKLVEVLQEYLACTAHFKQLRGPYAFATAGVRNAKNAKEVIARVRETCGLEVDLVSGREEARLGYIGAMRQSALTRGVQIDVGGGSTEVSVFENGAILYSHSIPEGSLSLFSSQVHDLLPTPCEADRIRSIVREELRSVEGLRGFSAPVASGTGGSVRAVARLRDAWAPDPAAAPGRLTCAQMDAVTKRVFYDPHGSMRDILRIAPERAHTCIPGLLVAREVLELFGTSELEVHDFGVREGYLLSKVLKPSRTQR